MGWIAQSLEGYIIAKNKYEVNNLFHYAEIIQKLQTELGLQVSSFPSLGLLPRKHAQGRSEDHDPSEEEEFDSIMRREQG